MLVNRQSTLYGTLFLEITSYTKRYTLAYENTNVVHLYRNCMTSWHLLDTP